MKTETTLTTETMMTLETGRVFVLTKHISPDPDQPRKHFDQVKLGELAASFGGRGEGLGQDLLVKPDPKKDGRFILVDGERRWRGAELVGIERVPIRVVSDEEAKRILAMQIVLNQQHENMTALEEAAAAKKLLDEETAKNPKFNKEDLGKLLGRGRAATYELLSLLNLSAPVASALREGVISPSHATRIAAVPLVEVQRDLLEYIQEQAKYSHTVSVRDLQGRIERMHCKSLKDVPFKLDKVYATVRPEACTVCPQRSGNMPNWPDAKNCNVCTNPTCFKAKALEHAKAEGSEVIDAKTYEKTKGQYVQPGDYDSYGNKGWCAASSVVGRKKPKALTTVTPQGEVIEVWRKDEFQEAAKKNGVKFDKPKVRDVAAEKAKEEKQEQEQKQREKVMATLFPILLEKVERLGGKIDQQSGLLAWLFEILDEDYLYRTEKTDPVTAKLQPGAAWVLAVKLVAEQSNLLEEAYDDFPDGFKALCKLTGFDLKAEEKKLAPEAEKESNLFPDGKLSAAGIAQLKKAAQNKWGKANQKGAKKK